MNRYSTWVYWVLGLLLVIGVIYALPNLYGEDPSIQISNQTAGTALTKTDLTTVQHVLKVQHLSYESIKLADKSVLVRFSSTDNQQKANEFLKVKFNNKYLVALTLAPAAPSWLLALGANPMKLGLDLRGGVHLLLQVDVNDLVQHRAKGDLRNIADTLRNKRLRYSGLKSVKPNGISISFRDANTLSQSQSLLSAQFPDYIWTTAKSGLTIDGRLSKVALQKIRQYAIEQTMQSLQRRVNELGIAEATVQQQGADRVSVDLPGVQDATRAQSILGKTATLEFHLVDTTHDPMVAAQGVAPPGSTLYTHNGQPILLKNQVILTGDSITNASSGFDQNGRPSVNIRTSGAGESYFYQVTSKNIGKPMATVYINTKSTPTKVNGKTVIIYKKIKRVINVATIENALGGNFQVQGMQSTAAANNLALLLRAGALVAPVTIIAERNVGPSMGRQNIHTGMLSLMIALGLVVVFILFYYSAFGLIANIALCLNLIFLVAIMSILGAVLTFPGIAGIVLTLGMAIDANVLIFERIREEMRNGVTMQAAIHAGYEKAFATIVDANVTTLIAAVVLVALGTGSIKGFAITLTIGLLTSMFTSVVYTRALTNLIFGGKKLKWIPIGIRRKLQGGDS